MEINEQALAAKIFQVRDQQVMLDYLYENTALRLEIEKIKQKLEDHGQQTAFVFRYLDELLKENTEPTPRKQVTKL